VAGGVFNNPLANESNNNKRPPSVNPFALYSRLALLPRRLKPLENGAVMGVPIGTPRPQMANANTQTNNVGKSNKSTGTEKAKKSRGTNTSTQNTKKYINTGQGTNVNGTQKMRRNMRAARGGMKYSVKTNFFPEEPEPEPAPSTVSTNIESSKTKPRSELSTKERVRGNISEHASRIGSKNPPRQRPPSSTTSGTPSGVSTIMRRVQGPPKGRASNFVGTPRSGRSIATGRTVTTTSSVRSERKKQEQKQLANAAAQAKNNEESLPSSLESNQYQTVPPSPAPSKAPSRTASEVSTAYSFKTTTSRMTNAQAHKARLEAPKPLTNLEIKLLNTSQFENYLKRAKKASLVILLRRLKKDRLNLLNFRKTGRRIPAKDPEKMKLENRIRLVEKQVGVKSMFA